ncbi:MAG: SUMF1/EgtB/PvdO family nonheme iron enzyme, partial [Verrucomicrobiota bacterium]
MQSVSAQDKPLSAGDHPRTITVKGLQRSYLLHVPPGAAVGKALPLVIMLHGGGGKAESMANETGWSVKADADGFMTAYPNAIPADPSKPAAFRGNPQTWNDGSGRFKKDGEVDDVAFIRAMIDDIATRAVLNKKRVYLTGFSNGASMAFVAGMELSERVAAIAPVAGACWLPEVKLKRGVPMCYITGTADPLNPLNGGPLKLGLGGKDKPPVQDSILKWVKALEAPVEPAESRETLGVRTVRYGPGRDGAGVAFVSIEGQGHGWPGGKNLLPELLVGKETGRLKAVDVIWDFFKALALDSSPSSPHAAEPITNSVGMKLVRIESGTFTMGQDGPPMEDYLRQKRFGEMSKDFDRIDFDEKPAHAVTISRPFLIGVSEVTVAQYRQFDPGFRQGDPKSKPADDDAASGVSWEKAAAFCEWLSQKEGKPYRLPTEAEWEYACRAGTTTLFHAGDRLPDGHQKWFGEDNYRSVYFPPGPMPREYDWRHAGKAPAKGLQQGQILGLDHPEGESRADGAGSLRVAQKTPNAWGLHDMHGNVAEWCLDWYGPYEAGPQTDPLGRVAGDCRVFRGGFHSSMIRFLRSANRGSWVANSASPRIGFRVVQGALPDRKPLPKAPAPRNLQGVSQTVPKVQPVDPGTPFFAGPQPFVRIPDGAVGPVFISQNHSPSITECPNGDLLAVWFSTLGETDLTTANAGSRLRFGAKEWEPASPFWDAQDVNDHAPKVWWDGDKTIYHIVEGRQHGDILIRRSTDNGATWSKAEMMRAHGESSGNPIRTKDGVIAIPFDFAGLSISRDNGKTWSETGRQRRGSDDIGPGLRGPFMAGIHEPIVELADGRLMAFGRLSPEEPAQKRFDFKMPVS